jgi:1-acyl-sn-glycerol-3-phosphate acyltransferase
LLYWVVKIFLTPILRVLYRPWVEGADNIPVDGPALLAPNHQSWLDWIFLPLMVPRKISFLAKADYFTAPGIKGWLQKGFFEGTGQVPIHRTGGSASAAALETGKEILDAGRLLGMYPEGTRSPDGRLFRGKTGVARLALSAGVPVIPIAMVGLYEIAPEGRIVPKIRRVGIRIGKPLDFSRYEGMEDSPQVLRSITDEIMYALMELGGQEYVDHYASQEKDERRAARAAASLPTSSSSSPSSSPPSSPPTSSPESPESERRAS